MERKISNCPIATFAICNRTNLRPNRKKNPIIAMANNEKPRTNQTTIKTII